MSFTSGVLTELKQAFERGDLMTKPIRQYMPKPANAGRPLLIRLKKMRTLWSGAGLNYNNDGELAAGTKLTLYDMPSISDAEKRLYKWVEVSPDRGGWVSVTDLAFETVKDEPPAVEIPTPPAPPPPADPPAPERKAHTWTITVTATDEEAAQAAALVALALDAINKLAGASAPVRDLVSRLVIIDQSTIKEGTTV